MISKGMVIEMGKGKVEHKLGADGKIRLKGAVGSHSTLVRGAKESLTKANQVSINSKQNTQLTTKNKIDILKRGMANLFGKNKSITENITDPDFYHYIAKFVDRDTGFKYAAPVSLKKVGKIETDLWKSDHRNAALYTIRRIIATAHGISPYRLSLESAKMVSTQPPAVTTKSITDSSGEELVIETELATKENHKYCYLASQKMNRDKFGPIWYDRYIYTNNNEDQSYLTEMAEGYFYSELELGDQTPVEDKKQIILKLVKEDSFQHPEFEYEATFLNTKNLKLVEGFTVLVKPDKNVAVEIIKSELASEIGISPDELDLRSIVRIK